MAAGAQSLDAGAARQTGIHNRQRAPALVVVVLVPGRLAVMHRPIVLVGQVVTGFRLASRELRLLGGVAVAVELTQPEPLVVREVAVTVLPAQPTQERQAAQILAAAVEASGQRPRLALAVKAWSSFATQTFTRKPPRQDHQPSRQRAETSSTFSMTPARLCGTEMAYFAQLGYGNIVQQVISVSNADAPDPAPTHSEPLGQAFIAEVLALPGEWRQTSYNGNFRKQYCGPGYTYDADADVFVAPQPFPSWTLDANHDWQPPTPMPSEGGPWVWDEGTLSWVEITA